MVFSKKQTFLILVALLIGCAGTGKKYIIDHSGKEVLLQSESDLEKFGSLVYKGNVFHLSGDTGKKEFIYERRVKQEKLNLVSTHITRDMHGKTAVIQSASHDTNYRLIEYSEIQNQLKNSGKVEVKDNTIKFTRFLDGNSESVSEKETDHVVAGPTLIGYILKHLEKLNANEELAIRFPIIERMESLGFSLKKVKSPPNFLKIEMKPSNLVIRLFVNPIFFTFNKTNNQLLLIEGQVPPKIMKDGKLQDFEARVEYQHISGSYL
jgi:hypothetical protein